MEIAILGNLTIDERNRVDNIPQSGQATRVEARQLSFGGRGSNIASALVELGGQASLYAVAGLDFASSGYATYLDGRGFALDMISVFGDEDCARFVTYYDAKDSIAFFFPNVERRHYDSLLLAECDYSKYGIVCLAQTGSEQATLEMIRKVRSFPGVLLALSLGGETARWSVNLAEQILTSSHYLFMNRQEASLLLAVLGLSSPVDILRLAGNSIKALVITDSANGSVIFNSLSLPPLKIPAIQPDNKTDALGAGDAYVGGFLYGVCLGWDLERCGFLAATVASFVLEVDTSQFAGIGNTKILERLFKALPPRQGKPSQAD